MSRCRTAILPENRGILLIMSKQIKKIVLPEDFRVLAGGHSFNVSIAKAFGLTEAILLQNFHYWHQCNKGNDDMFKDIRDDRRFKEIISRLEKTAKKKE